MTSVTPSVCSGPLSWHPRGEDTLSREEESSLSFVCKSALLSSFTKQIANKSCKERDSEGGGGQKTQTNKENKTS